MKTKKNGFTLLEMITVLAIISIISALLISGAHMHKKAVCMAKTRIQFLQYESAITRYCREYGNLPTFFLDEELVPLNEGNNAETFVKILSGREISGAPLSSEDKKNLNPKGKSFHSFADSEFFMKPDGTRDCNRIVDAFNNKNVFIIVEDPFDNDTIISKAKFPKAVQKLIKSDGVKNSVAIFSISEDERTIISNCIDQPF